MIDCDITKDLLPGYVDGVVSEKTAQAVEEHLQQCGECRTIYEQMKQEVTEEKLPTDKGEIDYLKKVKRRTGKRVLAVLGLVLVIVLVLVKLFIIGTPVNSTDVVYSVTIEDNATIEDTDGNRVLWITVELDDDMAISSEPIYEEVDGEQRIVGRILEFYQVYPSIFSNCGGTRTWGYNPDEQEKYDFTIILRFADKDEEYTMKADDYSK